MTALCNTLKCATGCQYEHLNLSVDDTVLVKNKIQKQIKNVITLTYVKCVRTNFKSSY